MLLSQKSTVSCAASEMGFSSLPRDLPISSWLCQCKNSNNLLTFPCNLFNNFNTQRYMPIKWIENYYYGNDVMLSSILSGYKLHALKKMIKLKE